jgi:hypothetical protein
MPRYFFNTRIGDELIVDPEGEDLRSPDRAWEVARQMILEVLRSEGTQPALLEAVIEVTDRDQAAPSGDLGNDLWQDVRASLSNLRLIP